MSEIEPSEFDVTLAGMRKEVARLQQDMHEMLVENCPRPEGHLPRQHRDGRPPWCPGCRRTALGVLIPPSAERTVRP